MGNIKWICVFLFGALFFDLALAQTTAIVPEEELGKKVRAASEVKPLGSTPFGEDISTYDGTLSFRQTDIDQPGLGLPLQLTRTYRTDDALRYSAFVDWKLEIPHIETLSANASGTEGDTPSTWFFLNDANRCSNFRQAPTIVLSTGTSSPGPVFYFPTKWWNGYQLVIPGSGAQDLLLRDSSNTASPQMPSDGGGLRNFHIVTKQNWMVSCLASTSNGKPGEGFLVVSPDGVKYWMDWLTYKKYKDVSYAQPGFGGVARRTAMMMVSRVEDRFGNSLSYSYDANGDLVSIQTSDGRGLVLTYDSWQVAGMQQPSTRIRTATLSSNDTPSRTWAYTYSAASDPLISQRLKEIVQPDGSTWSFNIGGLRYSNGAGPLIVYDYYDGCDYDIKNTTLPMQGEMVHPSGLIGQFNLKLAVRGRSYAPFLCNSLYGSHSLDVANVYTVAAMDQKKISGPGVPAQIWNYSYSPANQSWAKDCGSGCATNVWTEVTNPAGKAVRYTFSNRYDVSEGRLLRKDYFAGASGSSVMRAEEYAYASAVAGPWPSRLGVVRQPNVNKDQLEQLTPLITNTVTQDAATFNSHFLTFDAFARPLVVDRWSGGMAANFGRTDATEYHDNFGKWMLGQVAKVTNANTNVVLSQVDYDPASALPVREYAPGTTTLQGNLRKTLTYYADGNLATIKDGNSNVTTLSNWKRGIPQTIKFPIAPESPSGATVSATVNDNGWVTSVTDENGHKTCYDYDPMGRVSKIVYPSNLKISPEVCSDYPWIPTTIAFQQVATEEHGLPPGHWRSARRDGNRHTNTYYDALWRPVLEEELDYANISGTLRQTVKRYDASSRLAFQSYPTTNVGDFNSITQGMRTTYDALDRVTRVEQDSELGVLATTTEYLTGFKTRITPPKGQPDNAAWQTTTTYMAYDAPSFDLPVTVREPEGKDTTIVRDVFGKPAVLNRGGNGVNATRNYVYQADQQLCKIVEPETGATVYGYDFAGNLTKSASGLQGYGDLNSCNHPQAWVSGRVVDRTYDARNRLKTLIFPDGNGNQSWDYTPDSLPSLVTTTQANVVPTTNKYQYNKRRFLVYEQTNVAGADLSLQYAYDEIGSLSALTYPNYLTINYAPNALGQATQAGSYATGVQYYPNGGIKQFTYGNGIVHSMAQNARQLPSSSIDTGGVLNHGYNYDQNANVTVISDNIQGGGDGTYSRWMHYDGLDRLIDAGSCSFGGDCWHRFTYDALDNLKSWKLPGIKDYAEYVYDAKNQLTNIKNTAGASVIGISYDLQGNVTNKNGKNFGFDYGNRLRGSDTEWYAYDAHGRRILSCNATACDYQQYASDGKPYFHIDYRKGKRYNNIYLAGSVIAIREAGVDESNPQLKYQHTDALGSPVAVTDAAGAVVDRTNYEPYGAAINKPAYDGIGYTGHVMDSATGLTYMQQRYYDPDIGRFLSVDPVEADADTGGDFNRYVYAYNNPYAFTDPDGRQAYFMTPPPPPEPTTLGTVTATAPTQTTTLGTVSVIGIRPEPITFRPIPWPTIVPVISSTAAAVISAPFLYFFSPHPCGGTRCGERTVMASNFPPGVWPGPSGAEEWGRRNGVGAKEGRRRFHEIKQKEKGQGGGKGRENYGVNPDTGEVVNPAGEEAGNLGDGQAQ